MSKDKESKAKELQKSLTKKFELAWHALENGEKTMVDDFCESYKEYLTVSKLSACARPIPCFWQKKRVLNLWSITRLRAR